jgi:hypothetical protein
MRTTIIGPLVAVLLATGCASADQKMASKRDYRESQVAAIAVQETGRVDRAHASALEQQAMWKALAEVVKANPDAASHVAIVAAVAAVSGKDSGGRQEATMVTLRGEQDAALQWAQALAGPVLGTVGTLGVAAINNDMQKAIVRETTKVSIAQTEQDGRLYDVIGNIASNRGNGDSYVISDQGIFNQSGTVTAHTNNNSATATSVAPATPATPAATPTVTPITTPTTPTVAPTTTTIDDPTVSTFSPEEEPYVYNGPVPERVAGPDYDAGYDGDSIGGLMDIGHYGEEVYWDTPSFLGTLGVGDVLETPRGDYQVVDTREGTVGLLPIGDAHRAPGIGGHEVIWNAVVGKDQFGIDPYTGEAWVQRAIYMPGSFSRGDRAQ